MALYPLNQPNRWTFRRVMWATIALAFVAFCFWLIYRFYRLVSHRRAPGAAALVSDLIARQEHVMTTIRSMDEPPPRSVTSSMERLTQLIEKADPVIQTISPPEPAE